MIEQLADDVRMLRRRRVRRSFYVLGPRDIPSVLLEMGFLSNRQDEAMLKQPADRQVSVQAISDAINDYFAGDRGSSRADLMASDWAERPSSGGSSSPVIASGSETIAIPLRT